MLEKPVNYDWRPKSHVVFRDRPLRPGERYQHYCEDCGTELPSDFAYDHRCNPSTVALKAKLDRMKIREEIRRNREERRKLKEWLYAPVKLKAFE